MVLPPSVQRLVAFLTIRDRPMQRHHVAGTLWPETSDDRAAANLRSALWRLNQLKVRIVETAGPNIRLASAVCVDLQDRTKQAQLLLASVEPDFDGLEEAGFRDDLLPD